MDSTQLGRYLLIHDLYLVIGHQAYVSICVRYTIVYTRHYVSAWTVHVIYYVLAYILARDVSRGDTRLVGGGRVVGIRIYR